MLLSSHMPPSHSPERRSPTVAWGASLVYIARTEQNHGFGEAQSRARRDGSSGSLAQLLHAMQPPWLAVCAGRCFVLDVCMYVGAWK